MEQFRFNINDYVKVKLTDLGYQCLADNHNSFLGKIPNWDVRGADYYKDKADKEGYSKFQMWDFMQTFGEHIGLCKPDYFDLNIVFSAKNLHPTLSLKPEEQE